ncbi:MAG: ABC transporter substrate-binding protein [Candidatus Binatia bacterium]
MIRSVWIFSVILALAVPGAGWGAEAAKRAPAPAEKALSELMKLPANERIMKLVEGARKEGTLVWYAPDREELTNLRIEFFKQIYPDAIQKFVTPRIRSAVMIDRLLTEQRAGKYQADVVWIRLPQVPVMLREGLLAKYVALEDTHIPERLKIGAEWRSLGNRLFHIMYNTKLVSEKDAPKSWEDLLDPKWKGKLILDDSSYDWFVGMVDYMGEEKGLEYMKRLAGNGLQIQQNRSNAENMVAAGEVPIMVANSGTSTAGRAAQGEPVAFVKDPKPPIAYGEGLAIMRNAPHPHAAALFLEGLLSERWQRKAAEKIMIRPARPGIPDPLIDAAIKPHFINPAKWPAQRYEWAQREYIRILVRRDF